VERDEHKDRRPPAPRTQPGAYARKQGERPAACTFIGRDQRFLFCSRAQVAGVLDGQLLDRERVHSPCLLLRDFLYKRAGLRPLCRP